MNPIDYTTQVRSPFEQYASGYALGQGIRQDQQAQSAAQAQQEAAIRQQQVMQGLISNPKAGAEDYAAATLLYPQMKDQFKQSWDMKNTAQQESMLSEMGQAYAATVSGQPQLAVDMLKKRADAMEASGANPNEIKAARTMAQWIEMDPNSARATIGMKLASIPGGDKVLTGASTMGTEQRAADLAAPTLALKTTEANTAPAKASLELANAAEDIETKRANREIAALETQIKQANSETQRGELTLKRDELVQKQTEAAKVKADTAQSKLEKLDLSLNTVNAITNHPGLEALGMDGRGRPGLGGVGTYTGKVAGIIPGSDRKDLQGLVDTLQAQQFLTGVQNLVGMGALSDAEGKKIGSAVASLDLDQSAGAFKNALGVIKSTLEKAQRGALASGTAPTSGGGFVMKVPGIGNVSEGDINRMMASNPGSTREQVLQYLSSKGGK